MAKPKKGASKKSFNEKSKPPRHHGTKPSPEAIEEFINCAEEGDLPALKTLFEKHHSQILNVKGGHKQETPLIAASAEGHLNVVRFLVASGAKLDVSDTGGQTALMAAAMNGYDSVVSFLIDSRAALDVVDEEGNTALFYAAKGGEHEIVKTLAEKGAALDLANKSGVTPLLAAIEDNRDDVVLFLLDKGASVLCQDSEGEGVMDYARRADPDSSVMGALKKAVEREKRHADELRQAEEKKRALEAQREADRRFNEAVKKLKEGGTPPPLARKKTPPAPPLAP